MLCVHFNACLLQADFVRCGHPTPAYAQAAETACMNLSSLVEKLVYSSLTLKFINLNNVIDDCKVYL